MLIKYMHSRRTNLKNESYVMFEEISSGVYHVVKDRTSDYGNGKFVTSKEVVFALNNESKISVVGNSGIYANFEL